MAKKQDILVRIGGDASGLTKDVIEGNKALKRFSGDVEGVTSTLGRLAATIGLGIGFAALGKEALEYADKVTKVAGVTGMTTDEVQRLDFIAGQTGNTLEGLTGAVSKMQDQLVKAADGGEAQAEAFDLLGIEAGEFLALDPATQFNEVAKAIGNIENSADQAAAAKAAFGKAGADLIPTLEAIALEGDALNERFDALGGPISADAIKALDDMGDAATAVGGSVRAFAAELLALAAPAVLAAMDGVTAFFGGLRVLTGTGANEMVNLDNEILSVTKTLRNLQGMAAGGDAHAIKETERLTARLADLRAQYQALADAPGLAVQAQKDALAAQRALGAEELADLVVHGGQKLKVELTNEQIRHMALMAQQAGFLAETEEMVRAHEMAVTDIKVAGITERMQFETMTLRQQSATVFGELEAMTAGVAQHNKALFNLNKAAGIANAIINMHEGITKSLATYPMPLAAVMAAAHAAAGMAQVMAIKNTKFNGGGAGTAPSQAAAVPTPVASAGGSQGGGGAGPERIMRVEGMDPSSLFSGKTVRLVAAELLEYQKDGGTVVLS
jgi:hypothetical protein